MTTEIVFEEDRLGYLLDLFGKEIDEEGYVVDSETGERVISTDDNHIKKADIGYVGHGSAEFVEDDISSITKYLRGKSE